jgi:hypothetical protein
MDEAKFKPGTDASAADPKQIAELLAQLFHGSSTRGHLRDTTTKRRQFSVADIVNHVRGRARLGAIPFAGHDSERVSWACIDLDHRKWDIEPDDPDAIAMVRAIVNELERRGFRVAIERSRSKGWHLWIFFDAAVLARDTRALLREIALTAGARNEADLVCPRQDRLARNDNGSIGNGIYLPLYGLGRSPFTRFHTFDAIGDLLPVEDANVVALLRELANHRSPASTIPPAPDAEQETRRTRPDKRGDHRPWSGEIPPRIVALIEKDPEIAARFNREPGSHADHTKSGIDASLAGLIKNRLEKAEQWEVDHALRASHAKAGISNPKKYNARYFQRCIELAFKDPEWLVGMNDEFACGWFGPNFVILREPEDPKKTVSFIKSESFKRALQNKPRIGKGETSVTRDIAWLRHAHRREYREIVFYPGPVSQEVFSLWRGFSVVPRAGSCDRYLEHLRTNICRGDETQYRWLEAYLAQGVQDPARRPPTAIVLSGGQGTGKGVAVRGYASLFDPHTIQVSQTRHFLGNFNAHLMAKLIVWADEAFWAGDKQGAGALKAMVTEPTIMIELKGRDAVEMPNYLRIFITSNADWVVPAGIDERRFAVYSVGEAHRNDHPYFAAIQEESDSGGREALLYHLLHVDTSKVDLRAIPQTAALREQKIHSLDPVNAWWLHRLHQGTLPPGGDERDERQWTQWRELVPCSALHDDFLDHAKKVGRPRRATETELGIALRKIVPSLPRCKRTIEVKFWDKNEERFRAKSERPYVYVMPSLKACREHFDRVTQTRHPWKD